MENEVINSLIENNGEDLVASHLNGVLHDSYSEEFIRDFINTFEDNKRRKIRKRKTKLEEFMEDDDADAITSAS